MVQIQTCWNFTLAFLTFSMFYRMYCSNLLLDGTFLIIRYKFINIRKSDRSEFSRTLQTLQELWLTEILMDKLVLVFEVLHFTRYLNRCCQLFTKHLYPVYTKVYIFHRTIGLVKFYINQTTPSFTRLECFDIDRNLNFSPDNWSCVWIFFIRPT